jgi:hypothetical protein
VPIRDRGVSLPARLAEVIDEALADDPDLAFPTAGELRDALRAT